MEQELISKNKFRAVAIIGAGPAGCICAHYLQANGILPVIFEFGKPLRTLLPTGGGRCNLAHAEFDFKELAKNYPRGEKFLYSVFSKFGTAQTLEFFNSIGIKTYTQDDNRVFPVSNSSADVREKLLKSISKCKIIKEKVMEIKKPDNCFKIKTNKASYAFDCVVIATGGHENFEIFPGLKINEPVQSLVGLVTKEDFTSLAGVCLRNVEIEGLKGDILFTHKGVSGPLIYKFSSINARKNMPYAMKVIIACYDLQKELDKNPHKEIKNLLGQIVPKSFAVLVLGRLGIDIDMPCHKINGITRDKIVKMLTGFEINVVGKVPDSEVVTCGGVDLNQINPKTMEAKDIPGLYFCGEVLDIDGFCGGFNLQNCWSTGAIAAEAIKKPTS